MVNLVTKAKPEIVYPRADWKAHNNRLGFDDLIDANGRFIATINVMDIAVSEMLSLSYLESDRPKELWALDKDGCWSIYISVQWLTPAIVNAAVQRLGKLLGRSFKFDAHHLPAALQTRYRRELKEMSKSAKAFVPAKQVLHDVRVDEHQAPQVRLPSKRRMAALLTQKLKS